MYLLECSDGSYYTGSTKNLERRLAQHQAAEGANHTKKRLPVKLVYYEEFQRIDEAFYREKQVQKWNRKKKEALIKGEFDQLPELAIAYRDKNGASRASAPADLKAVMVASRASAPSDREEFEALEELPEALEEVPEALEGNL